MAEKENIARFEGVIMKQRYSEAGTDTEAATTAQVIDEATGNVIAEAGAGGGGGEESDFTTAEVTFTLPEGVDETVFVFLKTNEAVEVGDVSVPANISVGPMLLTTDANKINVPLYKGNARVTIGALDNADYTVGSVSGNADYDDESSILSITGNCTVTLVAK